jgi:hypothetical protein
MEGLKKQYADLTEEEKEATYNEQESRINELLAQNAENTQSSLEQISALKAAVAAKKNLKALPGVEIDGEFYEVDFAKVHVSKGGVTVTITAEELVEDEELCRSLIELDSPVFKKVVVAAE